MIGLLNVDKPAGMTSHDVVQQVRRLAGQRRVGHAGTLDPLATGVLLVCLGRATRLVEYLVDRPKVYEATVRLGQETDTYDADGAVVRERPVAVTPAEVTAALALFRGEIEQVPPMYSAVKRDGQPLYRLARQGIEVARPPRTVTIYELTLLEATLPTIRLRVRCGAGTYIRAIAHDLGQALGCGAHVSALRRTAVGDFGVETAVALATLDAGTLADALLPPERAVAHLPALVVSGEEAVALGHGRVIAGPADAPADPLARAHDPEGRFLGLVARGESGWRPHKILM